MAVLGSVGCQRIQACSLCSPKQEPRPRLERIIIGDAIPLDRRCVDLRQLQPGADAGC